MIAAALAACLLGACNTVQGFGRDLNALGDALTQSSEEASGADKLDGAPGSRRP